MKKLTTAFPLTLLLLLFLVSLCSGKPTEVSLLHAWEAMQRNDSEVLIFDKVEASLYRFKTERFPFDGQLRVLNVTIDDRMGEYEYASILGVIEVELVDLPEDFLEKYSYSFSVWQSNNTLYYDKESQQWLTSSEFVSRTQTKAPELQSFFGTYLTTCLLIIVFIIILIVFFIAVSRLQKRNKKYLDESRTSIKRSLEIAEKSLSMSEESNKILSEILDELKKKSK
jgi:uncharacterized membrane protein